MTEKELLKIIEEAKNSNAIELNLSEKGIEFLPQGIGKLVNLKSLYLNGNKLKSLPPEIGNLCNLEELYLSLNNLSFLPSEIGCLTNLQFLDLSQNNLSFLPSEIGFLVKLQVLNLGQNNLNSLPCEISNLVKLQTLNLNLNKFKYVPPEIGNIKNLESLYLGENNLNFLPHEIGNLFKLRILHFGCNKLKYLPPEIGNLINLQSLHLYENNLTFLPPEIKSLVNLSEVYLWKNKITSLPLEMGNLINLRYISLKGNPLEFPPKAITRQGAKAIVNYLAALQEDNRKKLYESKLIVVGQGGVGKTCLCNMLIENTLCKQPSTEGISIKNWTLIAPDKNRTPMKIHVWDFGGQEIYHATHQFFLTRRSLYLLVWDSRQEDEYGRIDYWLRTITTFGEDSPIILIINKCESRWPDINLKDLRERYPQIRGFFRLSCTEPQKAPDQFDLVQEHISKSVWNLPTTNSEWPKSWFCVRKMLENDIRNKMDYSEYLSICRDNGLDEASAYILSEYLHDLGIILHFQKDEVLKHLIILKPEWATEAVYKVVNAKQKHEKRWILFENEHNKIWKEEDGYHHTTYHILLRLMENFEMAFLMENSKNYIVAELLQKEQLDISWSYADNIVFHYCYDFLPSSILPRFVVRMNEKIKRNAKGEYQCWKEGVILQHENTEAFVKAFPVATERKIVIRVRGEKMMKRELLTLITYDLDKINRALHRIKVEKKMPCICDECFDNRDNPHMFNYEFLRKLLMENEIQIRCEKSLKKVDIRKILYDDEYEVNFVKIAEDLQKILEIIKNSPQFAQNIEMSRTLEQAKSDVEKGNLSIAKKWLDRFGEFGWEMFKKTDMETIQKILDGLKNVF